MKEEGNIVVEIAFIVVCICCLVGLFFILKRPLKCVLVGNAPAIEVVDAAEFIK